jgi:hypothetical protein
MLITKMRLDGQNFFLAHDTDQSQLEQEIVAAVRGGGDFIQFDTHGHGRITALMTGQIPVTFEATQRSNEEVAGWDEQPPPVNVDPDFDF